MHDLATRRSCGSSGHVRHRHPGALDTSCTRCRGPDSPSARHFRHGREDPVGASPSPRTDQNARRGPCRFHRHIIVWLDVVPLLGPAPPRPSARNQRDPALLVTDWTPPSSSTAASPGRPRWPAGGPPAISPGRGRRLVTPSPPTRRAPGRRLRLRHLIFWGGPRHCIMGALRPLSCPTASPRERGDPHRQTYYRGDYLRHHHQTGTHPCGRQ